LTAGRDGGTAGRLLRAQTTGSRGGSYIPSWSTLSVALHTCCAPSSLLGYGPARSGTVVFFRGFFFILFLRFLFYIFFFIFKKSNFGYIFFKRNKVQKWNKFWNKTNFKLE
jgi:hypothetical protein